MIQHPHTFGHTRAKFVPRLNLLTNIQAGTLQTEFNVGEKKARIRSNIKSKY